MKCVIKLVVLLCVTYLSQGRTIYIDHLPLYVNYNQMGCLSGPNADRSQTRVYTIEGQFRTRLAYGIADTSVPVVGRKITMSCTGHSLGTKYFCYINCYPLAEYTGGLMNHIFYNYSSEANIVNNIKRTNNNGELWFYVGFGDKNYSWIPYYPNALENHPELPEIVALPDIPYNHEDMRWFSALALSAYVIQGAAVVQAPAYMTAILQGDIYHPYSGWKHFWGMKGVGPMPQIFIDRMGLDIGTITPPSTSALTQYIPEEVYSTEEPQITMNNKLMITESITEEIPRLFKNAAKDYGLYNIALNGFHILKYNSYWYNCNEFIVHNLTDINTPQDCKNYLESNWAYSYIITLPFSNPQNYNSKGFTNVLYSLDSTGKCLTKMPIFMAVKSKQENSITFISDYFYAMNDCHSQGIFYDNQNNKYVCIPTIGDGNLAVSQMAIEEYGDFNFDGIVNSKDFVIFAEKLKLTTQDEKYDMMFDYNKDNKIDNKDLFLFIKNWLKHNNRADFNIDGKTNLIDYSMLCQNFGDVNPLYDLNKNGKIDIEDLKIFKENYLYGESK